MAGTVVNGNGHIFDADTGRWIGALDAKGREQLAFPVGSSGVAGVVLQAGVPLVLVSSGSMANNGAITLTTALPFAYAACFMYLPAGAIVTGSSAGWYYAVMSSTTQATVYNNTYTTGVPTRQASPTPFVTTGPGAYTQTTGSAVTALSVAVPGGSMGPNGRLSVVKLGSLANTANNKVVETFLGGSVFASYTFTTSNTYRAIDDICNAGVENANIGNFFANIGGTAADWKRQTVNTAVDQLLAMTLRINTATDFASIESATVAVNYGA